MLLQDKVAVITGAASGFGRETCILFAQHGAKVVAADYDEAGHELAKEIIAAGGDAEFILTDVAQEDQVKNLIDEAVSSYGKIDIVFNNAGIYIDGKAGELSIEDWTKVLAVNLTGVFLGCKYAIPRLIENKGGVIINTASAAGLIGFPNSASYAASKGGVISLTKNIAVDYAAQNIRANCICPGTGKTRMTKEVLQDEKAYQMFLEPIPLKRFAQPSDIANAALFLASDLSVYITGAALPVDGGWTTA